MGHAVLEAARVLHPVVAHEAEVQAPFHLPRPHNKAISGDNNHSQHAAIPGEKSMGVL